MNHNINHIRKITVITAVAVAQLIIFFTIISDFVAVNSLIDTHIDYTTSEINDYVDDINRKCLSNQKIASQIYLEDVTKNVLQLYPEKVDELANRLSYYKSTDVYLMSIYIYDAEKGNLYVDGRYNVYKADSFEKDPQLPEILNEDKAGSPFILRKMEGRNIYTFIIHPYEADNRMIILNYHTNYFRFNAKDNNRKNCVANEQGKLLISPSNDAEEEQKYNYYIQKILSQDTKADETIHKFKDKNSIVVYYRANRLIYCNIIAYSEIWGQMDHIIWIIIGLLIVFVLLIVFSFSFGIKWLLFIFVQFNSSLTDLKRMLLKSNHRAKKSILYDLANNPGNVIPEQFESLKIKQNSAFITAILKIDGYENFCSQVTKSEQSAFRYAIINVLSELLAEKNYEIEELGGDEIIILYSLEPGSEEKLVECIQKTQAIIIKNLETGFSAFIGIPQNDVQDIPFTLRRLRSLSEHVFYHGGGCVLHLSAINPENCRISFDVHGYLDMIILKLDNLDACGATAVLADDLSLKMLNPGVCMIFFIQLLHGLRKYYSDNERNEHLYSFRMKIDEICLRLEQKSIAYQELLDRLHLLFDGIIIIINENKKNQQVRVLQMATRFIHDEAENPLLSKELVAAHVGISVNLLDRLFKPAYHQTVREYIYNYRLELAAKLLIEKDYPVSKIAEMTGYTHASHFGQNFKKKYNDTPEHYRNAKKINY